VSTPKMEENQDVKI